MDRVVMAIRIEKSDMLEMLNGLHYAAISAREGKLSQQSLDDQFNLIKETVSKWEDGEKRNEWIGCEKCYFFKNGRCTDEPDYVNKNK
jgi:hypothetical protein